MSFWELLIIAVGLSMDAFAMSVCQGLQMRVLRLFHAAVIALTFGVFQALMPLIGYVLGQQFSRLIEAFDHWVAFLLLAFIGTKMLLDAFTEKKDTKKEAGTPNAKESAKKTGSLCMRELCAMALATSIDALAVGITFACLRVSLLRAVTVIGTVTFAITACGVFLGHVYGERHRRKSMLAGGFILVGIGIKILVEHLFFT